MEVKSSVCKVIDCIALYCICGVHFFPIALQSSCIALHLFAWHYIVIHGWDFIALHCSSRMRLHCMALMDCREVSASPRASCGRGPCQMIRPELPGFAGLPGLPGLPGFPGLPGLSGLPDDSATIARIARITIWFPGLPYDCQNRQDLQNCQDFQDCQDCQSVINEFGNVWNDIDMIYK